MGRRGAGELRRLRATRQRDLPRGQTYERSARRGASPRPQKIPLLHGSCGNWLPREGAAERLRELPSALPGYFLLQETFLYAVPAGLAATQQLHCGRSATRRSNIPPHRNRNDATGRSMIAPTTQAQFQRNIPTIPKISIIYYVLSLIYYLKNIDIPSPFRYNKFNFHTKGDFHNELQSLGR